MKNSFLGVEWGDVVYVDPCRCSPAPWRGPRWPASLPRAKNPPLEPPSPPAPQGATRDSLTITKHSL